MDYVNAIITRVSMYQWKRQSQISSHFFLIISQASIVHFRASLYRPI